MSVERIVIVGGGFAGFWSAVAARRMTSQTEVILVAPQPQLEMRPRLYEADPRSLQLDLRPLLARVGVKFVQGVAYGLDLDNRRLELVAGGALGYSRLIVATGSVMRRPPVVGADDAFSIDTVAEATTFDEHLARVVAEGWPPTIAVVGAGFTGIELALELRDRIAVHGSSDQAERARLILIDRAPVIGLELGSRPRTTIEGALTDAHIERLLGVSVTALGRDSIQLSEGRTIHADAVVLTTGMVAAGFVRHIPGEHDSLGRVLVDRALRAPAAPGVFAAGDAAAADGGDGHAVVQSCQHALQLGRFAGENAARDLLRLPALPYVQPPYVTCLDLGRSGAVFTRGWDREVEFTGARAKDIKRRINTEVIYPPAEATGDELLRLSDTDVSSQGWEPKLSAA